MSNSVHSTHSTGYALSLAICDILWKQLDLIINCSRIPILVLCRLWGAFSAHVACSRRSDSGARGKNIATERAGKNEGKLGKSPFSPDSPRFPALSLAIFFARAPLSERLEQATAYVQKTPISFASRGKERLYPGYFFSLKDNLAEGSVCDDLTLGVGLSGRRGGHISDCIVYTSDLLF